jgi:octaprenyl-diphosphate synthase
MALIEDEQSAVGHVTTQPTSGNGNGVLKVGFTSLYRPVAKELLSVEQILRRELVSRHQGVNRLLQHGVRLGGKRLRPALLLLAASATGGRKREAHLLLAAVLEMIHTATLVHDDVLDGASIRRHHATVNAMVGNEASVLLGDFLFSHAFYLASSLESTFACQRIGRTTNIVCEGELRQIQNRGNYTLNEDEYLEIIEAKTAELCACCCELGAHYAGADAELQAALRHYGRNLGIAFQIVDDLLDLTGEQDHAGKSLGTDLDLEKPTLPLIRLLAQADPVERRHILATAALPPAERRSALCDRLCQSGTLESTRATAHEYAEAARSALCTLPSTPARDSLQELSLLVVSRRC